MNKKEQLLDYLNSNKSKGYNEIVTALPWSKKLKKENQEFLEELVKDGDLVVTKGNRYTTPEKMGLVKGILDISKERFGFVDTDGESIFVHRRDFKDAVSGDTVLVKINDEGKKSRKREGEIVRVVKRAKNRILGVFEKSRDFGFVVPREKFGKDIFITRKNRGNAKDGDLVVVEVTFWGAPGRKPEGKIVDVLGDAYDSKTMIDSLAIKYSFPVEFSMEAKKELSGIKNIDEEAILGRRDLRGKPLITIDGADARDLDDSVYLEELGDEKYKLYISIADVSYYIDEGSALDIEARERGNSIYLVDRVIPMFPREISNGVCSLNAGVDRLALTAEITIDKNGKILDEEVYRSVINVKYRMTYSDVNKIYDKDEVLREEYFEIVEMLEKMLEISHKIREKRHKNGSIDFDFPEIKVNLDEKEKVDYISTRERGESERVIEDFMILANEVVAEKIFWLEYPSIYRTHDAPDIEKIKELNDVIGRFGYSISGLDDLHPGKFQKLLEKCKNEQSYFLITKLILRSLKQARYTKENTGHFGLASGYYTHFTSPIRRYADLIVHRVLVSGLDRYPSKKALVKMEKFIDKTAIHISTTERTAMKAENESIKIKVVEYMMDKLGEEYDAIISGMIKNGVFVELSNHVEAFYPVNDVADRYFYDEKNFKIIDNITGKEYTLGDKIKIIVARVDLKALQIDVAMIEEE